MVCGPPLEIHAGDDGFFDFATKYQYTVSPLEIAQNLDESVVTALQEQAIRAFTTLGCTGLLRVDFFVTQDQGETRLVVNEVNTFPGFTAKSQYPLIWQSAGLEFSALLTVLLETALTTGLREGPGRTAVPA